MCVIGVLVSVIELRIGGTRRLVLGIEPMNSESWSMSRSGGAWSWWLGHGRRWIACDDSLSEPTRRLTHRSGKHDRRLRPCRSRPRGSQPVRRVPGHNECRRLLLIESADPAVVVGSGGLGGVRGALIGSMALRSWPVPRARWWFGGTRTAGPVVAGLDATGSSEHALHFAFDEVSTRRVPVLVVHAFRDGAEPPSSGPRSACRDLGPEVPALTIYSLAVRDRRPSQPCCRQRPRPS